MPTNVNASINASDAITAYIPAQTWHVTTSMTPPRVPVRDLFDVLVFGINEVEFIPKNELAKSILAQWAHGVPQMTQEFRGEGQDVPLGKYGRCMTKATLRFASRPLIASGDDPFWTGMIVSKEEHDVARKAVEAHRKRQARAIAAPKKRARR